jgi:hypothetical protein
MTIFGHVHNGVVVPDSGTAFPEGSRVSVTPLPMPSEPQTDKRRVDFPLVRTGKSGTWDLKNQQIGEVLEKEEIAALKGKWNVPA